METLALCLLLAAPTLASPTPASLITNFLQERSHSFEWTAWGDSYASGVGSGKYIGGRRCLRYDGAYPPQMEEDASGILPGTGGKFNNVVQSGATAEEVELYQFYETEQHNKPNRQFDPRPASGKPTMGTLTVGGDDIDFPGILNNCIVQGFPWPLSSGFTDRSCDDQRALSWSLICGKDDQGKPDHDKPNPDLVKKFDSVIKKILDYSKGADFFRLYVTGYGQFFNENDPGCNDVTFARKPKDDSIKMTTDLRKDFNTMSRTLNKAIKAAVEQNTDTFHSRVRFVDIDSMLDTHRFCEPGVTEPDQKNEKLFFWHYPYSQTNDETDPNIAWLNQVAQDNTNALTWDPKKTLYRDYVNSFWDVVADQSSPTDPTRDDDVNAQYDIWRDTIGPRAKIFHPQVNFHKAIYEKIIKQYKEDTEQTPDSTSTIASSATAPTVTTTFSPPIPALEYEPGTCHLHINQWEIACLSDVKDYQAEVYIYDNGGSEIGHTDGKEGSFPSINAEDPLSMKSKLQSDMVVIGEHAGDDGPYVRFTLKTDPQLSWTSQTTKDQDSNSYCNKPGGWDPKEGPTCSSAGRAGILRENSKRQMDCYFKC